MGGKAFLDTNILVYAHDRNAGKKHSVAKNLLEELWNAGSGVVSTQVLQEFCVTVRRRANPPLSTSATRSLVQDYLSWEVVVNASDSILAALELESRYKISYWDALILCAAEKAAVDVLYSEDLSAGQKYGSVVVVNPFQS